MQENLDPSFANIHFPQRTTLIKKLRYVSFIINDIILITYILIFLVWIFNIPTINSFLFDKLSISPFSSVLFLLSGCILLFGAKRHLMNNQTDTEIEQYPWWNFWIPILLAVTTAILGFINFTNLNNYGLLPLIQVSPTEGVCFFLIALALIPPFTRILHRFHITQFIIFLVTGLSVLLILEYTYQLFSPLPIQHIVDIPLTTTLSLSLFCVGILLRWTNRGFVGNFTLNSTGSMFASRLLLINLLATPLLTFIILTIMKNSSFNMYQILSLVVVGFTFISCSILWINVKLLYGYELEHLLMRESLHKHNINLTEEHEELQKKMAQLEQEKQHYAAKLNVQDKWRDMADKLA